MDYLAATGIVAFRMNTGVVMAEYKGRCRPIKFGVTGMSDLLAIATVSGKFKGFPCQWTTPLFVEVKAPKGRQSAEQRSFERQVKDAGAEYVVVRSVDDMRDFLRQHGVIK
jgi:hypothetical protein